MAPITQKRDEKPMRAFKTIDELTAAVEEPIGPTEWVTIDQERVAQFAQATGDHQWIHVDLDRARNESPFGGTIAHGYLTLSLIPWFASSMFTLEIGRARLNYGVNKVRFPNVVRVGSRLRTTCSVASVSPIEAGHLLRLSFTIEIEGESKPACVAETLTVLQT